MYESRFSDNDVSKRDVPSFIEPRPPLISNPFMRPRPQKGTNLLELFEDDSECEEPELVQVYLRLKPCNIPSNLYEVRSERCLITSLDTTTAGHGRRTQHNVSKMYTFSHIFGPEASQKEIFEKVVKDNLRKLSDGHSFTLLTYGASGSGKTYTLMGTVASPGLVPRSLEYVFRVVEAAQQPLYKPSEGGADKLNYAEQDYELQWVKRLRQVSAPLREKYRRMSARLCGDMTASTIDLSNRTRYYVWVSFVEIYNEGIYDLLAPGERRNASKLLIREDSNGNVYVKGATQAFVRTGEEAYDVMVAGKHNLQVAATGVHAQSSRSHCIFTITMLTHTEEGVRASCVRLCDLAGCERQRRARNTGARMQESRAINSSLHVLERCLHTLRRKQRATKAALVPYRESKLTRLLGAGLSGARGEAVSMVVTLNPAPEYAHETRHVLQLAAVARDIQVNNTISDYPSTLESSQDTTLSFSSDILKLRAENERLHFELIQAQSRNKELMAAMEERQAASADTMREVAEEAKDITRQYYEAQLQALRDEMEEMVEEYESRLSKFAAPPPNETSSTALQNKITQLMTEIAILEEKLNAEKLARARAEEEVQHLRACIEERDEKLEENTPNNDDIMSLTDSDNDSDDNEDPCNESLEPTFTKEDINRSRLIRQSLIEQQSSQDSNQSDENSVLEYSALEKSDDSVLDKSTDTIKDNNISKHSLDETYATGNESESRNNVGETGSRRLTMSECVEKVDNDSLMTAVSKSETRNNFDETSIKRLTLTDTVDKDGNDSLMTDVCKVDEKKNYFEDANETNTFFDINDVNENNKNTYFNDNHELKPDNVISSKKICRGTYFVSEPKIEIAAKESIDDDAFHIKNEIRKTEDSDTHYETMMQDNYSLPLESNSNITGKSLKSQESMDALDNNSEITIPKGKEKVDDCVQWEIPRKASETLVSKIIKSLKSSTNSNSSLAQFEQLEQATKNHKSEPKEVIETFSNIKILKEKRNYFDDAIKETAKETAKPMERKTYFDNISANIKIMDKRLTEMSMEIKEDDFRSPSIVKEDVTKDFEPSTIKKLLGESFTRQPDPIQTIVDKSIIKKQESIDVFDSPQAPVITPFKPEHKVTNSTYDNVPITLPELTIPKHIPEIKVIQPSLDGEVTVCNTAQEQNVISKKSPTKDEKIVIGEISKHIPEIKVIQPSLDGEVTVGNTAQEQNVISKKSPTKGEKIVIDETVQEQKTDFNKSPIKNEKPIIKSPKQEKRTTAVCDQSFINSTIEEFENIYKAITTPRATEFESLVTQETKDTQVEKTQEVVTQEEIKYNLRHKSRPKPEKDETKSKNVDEEVLLGSQLKSESKPTTRRNLRLRRRKNMTDEEKEENDRKEEKLKDIRNLQNEYSDVTIDVPAPVKEVKDIASPEKVESESENVPPTGIQSCPSKSVTRSRRKLFTPRAEPLEESLPGDSNERVYVPRPSYHRPRARRKL